MRHFLLIIVIFATSGEFYDLSEKLCLEEGFSVCFSRCGGRRKQLFEALKRVPLPTTTAHNHETRAQHVVCL